MSQKAIKNVASITHLHKEMRSRFLGKLQHENEKYIRGTETPCSFQRKTKLEGNAGRVTMRREEPTGGWCQSVSNSYSRNEAVIVCLMFAVSTRLLLMERVPVTHASHAKPELQCLGFRNCSVTCTGFCNIAKVLQ